MAVMKTSGLLTGISGSVGGVTFRTQGGKVIVSSKSSGRLGLRKSGQSVTTTNQADLFAWAQLSDAGRKEWEAAAKIIGVSARKAWLSGRRWLRATATNVTPEAGEIAVTGRTWLSAVSQPVMRQSIVISYNGGTFGAFSYDGYHWTMITSIAPGSYWAATWDYSRAVYAVAQYGGTAFVAESPDGVNWTTVATPGVGYWLEGASSQSLGMTCFVGQGGMAYCMTRDYSGSWTARPGLPAGNWQGICWAAQPARWIAVRNGSSSAIYTSTDGATWTASTTPVVDNLYAVAWSPDLGLGVALSGSSPTIAYTSTDGQTWTPHATTLNGQYHSLRWSSELGAFYTGSISVGCYIATSTDGINWTSTQLATSGSVYATTYDPWNAALIAAPTGSSQGPRVMPIATLPETPNGGPNLRGHQVWDYEGRRWVPTLSLTSLEASSVTWQRTTSGGKPAIRISVPAITWTDFYGQPGEWKIDATAVWLELYVGSPLRSGQKKYTGKWKLAGHVVLREGAYISSAMTYPWTQTISAGTRLPVRYRLYAAGMRSSPVTETIVTLA